MERYSVDKQDNELQDDGDQESTKWGILISRSSITAPIVPSDALLSSSILKGRLSGKDLTSRDLGKQWYNGSMVQ